MTPYDLAMTLYDPVTKFYDLQRFTPTMMYDEYSHSFV